MARTVLCIVNVIGKVSQQERLDRECVLHLSLLTQQCSLENPVEIEDSNTDIKITY